MRGRRIFREPVDPYLAPAWQDPPEPPEEHMMADETEMLKVTMTPRAAERLEEALGFAVARLCPDLTPPATEREKVAYDHVSWLSWCVGRIANAKVAAKSEKEN